MKNKSILIACFATLSITAMSCSKDSGTTPTPTPVSTDSTHHFASAKLNRPQLIGAWECTGYNYEHYTAHGTLQSQQGFGEDSTDYDAADQQTIATFYDADTFNHKKPDGYYEGALMSDMVPGQGNWSGQTNDSFLLLSTIANHAVMQKWYLRSFSASKMEIQHLDTATDGTFEGSSLYFTKQ